MNDAKQELLDKIAIVGMVCRFPGAGNIEEFWENLCNGVNSISSFSKEELQSAGISPLVYEKSNFVNAKGVIDNTDMFDANFFEMSPKEVTMLDPQHRVFLECAWEALEVAGYSPDSYPGRIGVYGGTDSNTYLINNLLSNKEIFTSSSQIEHILSDKDYLASRVSYKLNLKGPSIAVQSACSSSMVAIHLACESLLNGESDMVLAGGVSITFPIKSGYYHESGGIISPEGKCRAFDRDANGTIYGNGVGIVVLKRLEDAVDDGDTIHAVIRGTAVNNDGAQRVGYTAPSIDGQASVIREALNVAGVSPETISYVETHGTGTKLGDTIEFTALNKAFSSKSDSSKKNQYCAIGSVKTNIGHLSTAAGIASFIKTVLSLENKMIPPSLNYENPNPIIEFENSPFYVNTKLKSWDVTEHPRRAGVSSFGLGGTNVHMVLEEAQYLHKEKDDNVDELIILSAKTEEALGNATQNLMRYLKKCPDTSMKDMAYTLQVGRKSFQYRKYFTCSNTKEAIRILEEKSPNSIFSMSCKNDTKPVVYMFSGFGEQHINMAFELYQENNKFKKIFDECIEVINKETGRDYLKYIYWQSTKQSNKEMVEPSMLNKPSVIYPILFAVEYAIAMVLMDIGIIPDAMIGHSVGEYVAACLSGVLDWKDAIVLLYKRGTLIETLPKGAMLTVMLREEQVKPYLNHQLSLCAVNTSNTCGVSGNVEEIKNLELKLLKNNIACKIVATEFAFHSYMMESITDKFLVEVTKIKLSPPKIPYLSNVTGNWAGMEVTTPEYWVKHLSQPVRFLEGFQKIKDQMNSILVEIGPGNTLCSFALQIISNKEAVQFTVPTLNGRSNIESSHSYFLKAIGKLWSIGVVIDWRKYSIDKKCYRLALPTYPFQREKYYISPNLREGYEEQPESNYVPLYERPFLEMEYVAPRNEMDRSICEIWKGFLGIKEIGIKDDFFSLGGNSLLALQIMFQIEQKMKVEISMSEFINNPSISYLSDYITSMDWIKEEQEDVKDEMDFDNKKTYIF